MKNKIIFLSFLCLASASFTLTQFYSQDGQDDFIYNYFFKDKKESGIFVDIGAHDGITFSNTYFLEKELGWRGICIEPLPEIFKKLSSNRSCVCINGCISDTQGTAQFLSIQGYSEMLSGLVDMYHPKHLNRIERELAQYGGEKKLMAVQCYRLKDILEKYNVNHIDYLSIDVEGSELAILKSIDFSSIDIDIISVENNYNDPNFQRYLNSHNYKLVKKIGGDEIYQKIKSEESNTYARSCEETLLPRLLIKIPTRSRPTQFFKYLDLYYEKLSGQIPYHFLISCDNDDPSMMNPEVIERLSEYPNLSVRFGNSLSKIEAYNKDINEFLDMFDILILSSDDMKPEMQNFDLIIAQEMLNNFPDFDGVLNFSGGRDPEQLKINVYPIIGKNWYLRFGYVYYPGYKSLFCDNELSEISDMLNKEKIFHTILFRHKYPAYNKLDSLYIRNDEMGSEDEKLYKERKTHNFFLSTEKNNALNLEQYK